MPNYPVSGLPPANALADADLFETTQSGTSKKATVAQIKTAVGRGNVVVVDAIYATATFSTSQIDATAAIQAAVDAAEALVGLALVVLPSGFLRVTATITCDADNVVVVGAHEMPGAWIFDMPTSAGCTVRMHAASTVTGPVFDFTNGALSRRVYGLGLRGVTVDHGTAGNHATIGVRLRSVAAGTWSFGVNRVDAGCTGLLCTVDTALAAGQGDVQENDFEWVSVVAVDSAHTGKCIHLTGDADSNTSLNYWGHVSCIYSNGHGIDLDNCDGEFFSHVRQRRATGATGRGMIFRSDPASASGNEFARGCTIAFAQPGAGGIEFEGDNGGAWNASENNSVLSYSLENSGIRAVYGANAGAIIRYYDGTQETHGQTSPTLVQAYTSGSSTWTKPTWATVVEVHCIAGGGGGGAGRKGAAGTVRCGGGGGSGGSYSFAAINAADLTATVNVTVGPGAAGGAAQTTNSTDGAQGASGSGTNSASYFGATNVTAYVRANGGTPGLGGTATSGTGAANSAGTLQSQGGASASASGGAGSAPATGASGGSGGGGSGGGITTGDAASAGGAGGVNNTRAGTTAPSGGAVNTAGSAATSPLATSVVPGNGGGGGGSSTTTNAGAGGAGIVGGGGGGGGAAVDSVGNSGAGGAGGAGLVVIISRQ